MNLMMAMGRVGSTEDVRYTQQGTAVMSFSVAVDYGYGDRKETTWLKCTLWGKRAESLAPYIAKGDMIGVSGEIKLDQWENQQSGKSGANILLNVKEVTLGGGAQSQQRSDAAPQPGGYQPPPGAQQPAGKPAPAQDFNDFDDDIPF